MQSSRLLWQHYTSIDPALYMCAIRCTHFFSIMFATSFCLSTTTSKDYTIGYLLLVCYRYVSSNAMSGLRYSMSGGFNQGQTSTCFSSFRMLALVGICEFMNLPYELRPWVIDDNPEKVRGGSVLSSLWEVCMTLWYRTTLICSLTATLLLACCEINCWKWTS